MVDYAAIAKRFGAKSDVAGEVSFAPEQAAQLRKSFPYFREEEQPTAAGPDYGALARQFGAVSTEAAPQVPVTEDAMPYQRRTWPEAIVEGITNIPSSGYKFGAETLSMLNPMNIPETARGLELTGYGAMRKVAEKALPTTAFAYLSKLENPDFAAQAQQAAEAAGGHYARYFTEDGWKEAIATDPVGTMADLSMIASGIGGGLRAAGRTAARTPALAQPLQAGGAVINAPRLSQAARPFEQFGQAIDPLRLAAGGIQNAAIPLMAKGTEFANRIAAPRYYALQQAVGDKGAPIINALRSSQAQLVPGTQPTAGAVASGVPSTGFAGLLMSAMKEAPDQFRAVEQANIAARQKALETAAGGPKGVETARARREGITAPMYEAAKKIKVPEDATLQELMSRPVIGDVARVARDIAKNKGEAFKIGETAPAQTVASAILDEFGRPVTREMPATMAEYSVRDLHNMKTAMDRIITKGPREFAIERMDLNALRAARKDFVNWLDSNVPEYAAARAEYARLSKPVNQAEVLSYLKDTLEGVMKGEQRGRAFVKAAAKDAPKTIQRAIDAAPRYQDLNQILEPKQIELVKNIARDLEREEQFADLAAWRGQMGPKAAKIGEEASFRIPQVITDFTAVLATRVFKAFQGKVGEQEAIKIAMANLDPKAMAVLLGEAMMAGRKMKTTVEKRAQVMKNAAAVMRSPQMLAAQRGYNAMVEEPLNAMTR
jgi:hypothetical protein